jgi:hypothetical protein
MNVAVGVILAFAVGNLATRIGFDRERSFYPTVMIVIASYYVLFAVMSGSAAALGKEAAVMAVFSAVAIAGFSRTQWLVVAALAAHGLLDSIHGGWIENPGVPSFWPGFCLAFDVCLAGFLARRLLRAA